MSILKFLTGDGGEKAAVQPSATAGLYVDIENLRESAKSMVGALVESWPDNFPKPGLITLYVPADQVELWRMWGVSHFKGSQVRVRGIQRFSGHLSKNSADIAIATDAVADFVRARVRHVAVFSDDSDFMSLYVKIREEAGESRDTPFLWVLTDRRGTKSYNIRRYFPSEHIYVLRSPGNHGASSRPSVQSQTHRHRDQRDHRGRSQAPARLPSPAHTAAGNGGERHSRAPVRAAGPAHVDPVADRVIAEAIVERMPVGYFKSTDCQSIIREMYPNHPLAHASSGAMGQRFVKSLLPLLMEMGVTEPNPNRRPRRYQITEEAKHRPHGRGTSPVAREPVRP